METASRSELARHLQNEGLEDFNYWIPKFAEIGVTNVSTLHLIEGNEKVYHELKEQARKGNHVEVAALQKILQFDVDKQKQEEHEKAEAAQENLQKLDEMQSNLSTEHGERFRSLDNKGAKQLGISFGASHNLREELTAKHEHLLRGSGQEQARSWLDDKALLKKASGGRALQGIKLTDNLLDQLERRNQIIKVPEHVELRYTPSSMDDYIHFESTDEEQEYIKKVREIGSGFAISGSAPVYGSVAIGGGRAKSKQTEDEQMQSKTATTTYISTARYLNISKQCYNF
ncbi:MAG: hypothetical protein MJE68_26030, partial [Proteobacteria bacterium]|nr:hypothetical protein [Pseudomonadota bacterium]